MGKRRSRGIFSKAIAAGYKMLSRANTLHVLTSGDPVKISRHMTRKKTVKLGSKIVPGKRS